MVLMSSDTWLTETPNAAGSMSFSTRAAPGWRGFSRQRGSMPMRARNGSCSASCKAPPTNTAQASASTGGSKRSAKNAAATMNETLSSTGVNAGTANRLQVLSTPAASATSEMNRMYGKVMRSNCTMSSNCSGFWWNQAGANR